MRCVWCNLSHGILVCVQPFLYASSQLSQLRFKGQLLGTSSGILLVRHMMPPPLPGTLETLQLQALINDASIVLVSCELSIIRVFMRARYNLVLLFCTAYKQECICVPYIWQQKTLEIFRPVLPVLI